MCLLWPQCLIHLIFFKAYSKDLCKLCEWTKRQQIFFNVRSTLWREHACMILNSSWTVRYSSGKRILSNHFQVPEITLVSSSQKKKNQHNWGHPHKDCWEGGKGYSPYLLKGLGRDVSSGIPNHSKPYMLRKLGRPQRACSRALPNSFSYCLCWDRVLG